MYSVVVFDDQGEEACAVLSSSWVKNGIATWPSISGPSFGESVKLHLTPPPSSSRFPVTTIFQTNDYLRARRYAKKAESTSDLDSSDVTVKMGKRIQRTSKPPRRLLSMSSSDESNVSLEGTDMRQPQYEPLPLHTSPADSLRNIQPALTCCTPRLLPATSSLTTSPKLPTALSLTHVIPSPTPVYHTFSPKTISPIVRPNEMSPSATTSQIGNFSTPMSPPQMSGPSPYSAMPAPTVPSPASCSSSSVDSTTVPVSRELLNTLLRQQTSMMVTLNHVVKELTFIKERQDSFRMVSGPSTSHDERDIRAHLFPVQTVARFKDLESDLRTQSYRKVVMDYLHGLHAPTARQLVRRCMRETIGTELALHITYAGGKEKIAFKDCTLRHAIEEIVLSKPPYTDISREDIITWMRIWFYNARDRGGIGRMRRKRKRIDGLPMDL